MTQFLQGSWYIHQGAELYSMPACMRPSVFGVDTRLHIELAQAYACMSFVVKIQQTCLLRPSLRFSCKGTVLSHLCSCVSTSLVSTGNDDPSSSGNHCLCCCLPYSSVASSHDADLQVTGCVSRCVTLTTVRKRCSTTRHAAPCHGSHVLQGVELADVFV